MTPRRKKRVDGRVITEYWWAGYHVVYINNTLARGVTFEEADTVSMITCRKCRKTVPARNTFYHDAWEVLCDRCNIVVREREPKFT